MNTQSVVIPPQQEPAGVVPVIFQVWSGGQPMGGEFSGWAQEVITNVVMDGENVPSPSDWVPVEDTSIVFYLDNGKIYDAKQITIPALTWVKWPVGYEWETFTQSLRLAWYDPCGQLQYSYLGSFNLGYQKVDGINSHLVQEN
jgi:hypothetical protein